MSYVVDIEFPVAVNNKKRHHTRVASTGDILRGLEVERIYSFNGNPDRVAFMQSPYDGHILMITTRFNVRYTTWNSITEAKLALRNGSIVTNVVVINGRNEYIISEEDDNLDNIEFKLVNLEQIEYIDCRFEAEFKKPIKGMTRHRFMFALTDSFFNADDIDSEYQFKKDFDKVALIKTIFYPKVFLITQTFKVMLTNWNTLNEAQEYVSYDDLVAHYVHVNGLPYALIADADENIEGVVLQIPEITHVEGNSEESTKTSDDYIESSTQYSRQIRHLNYDSFSDIQELSAKHCQRLEEDELNLLFDELDHGAHILTNMEQLYAYMYCYGKMHEAKLIKAFKQIPPSFFRSNDEIEVIDYACGQAIATICLKDYMNSKDYHSKINRIILIDPSAKALARASLHCQKVIPESDIITIKKDFDGLIPTDIPRTEQRRIHLLSNILDIDNYDIRHLANFLNRTCSQGDLFVCIDPWYHDTTRDGRQRKLMRLLNAEELYHDKFNRYQLVDDKTWTAIITIFKK